MRTFPLFGSMLRLMFPPQSTKDDELLLEAIARNTAVSKELSERAANVDRALSNIGEACEGLFA